MNEWMTLRELAKYLKISEFTASVKTKRGELPGHKIPGSSHWRYRRDEVDRAILVGKPGKVKVK